MNSLQKASFPLSLLAIFLISLALRFWRLTQFNTLVFDEIYYAQFGNDYLTGTPFFNVHPPLAQYLIAIGIWLTSHLPLPQDTFNGFTGSLISTFSYRWVNALLGSFIPIVVAGITYQLFPRQSFSLTVAVLSAADGLFLVESRYALSNIYLIFFGLLGQFFLLLAINQSRDKLLYLLLSGIALGCTISVKWNGLGFILGIILSYLFIYKLRSQLSIITIFTYLLLIPFITYIVLWIPHLIMNPNYNLWEIHVKSIEFHRSLGADIHPYCSPWYSWLFMWRPIAYFYATALNTLETVPSYPPLPKGTAEVVYDVHGMGNPFLWWLSTTAIFFLVLFLWKKLYATEKEKQVYLFILCNYSANFLPWIAVTRCSFIYYYMGAYVFSWMALAWLIHKEPKLQVPVIVLVILAFIYWLPIYLGLPITPEEYPRYMWFKNWI